MIDVWFWIGALLGTYGVLLTGAGIYQLSHPPDTVLAEYHATLVAGVALLVIGGAYVLIYRPRPGRSQKRPSPGVTTSKD